MRFPSVHHIMMVFDAWRFIQRAKLARSPFFLLSNCACVPVTLAQSLGFRINKGGEEEREEEGIREKERKGERGREGGEGEEGNRMTRRVRERRTGVEEGRNDRQFCSYICCWFQS